MQQIKEYNVEDIVISDIAIRGENTKDVEYLGLKKSIQERNDQGLPPLQQPIILREDTNKDTGKTDLVLVDGLQRLTAHKELGLKKIAGINQGKMTNMQAMIEQYTANKHRVRQKPAQEGQQFMRMCAEDETLTVSMIAQMVGQSIDYVNVRLSLVKLPDNVQALVDDGSISVLNAKALLMLPEDSERIKYLQEAMQMNAGDFGKLIQDHKKELQAAAKTGSKPKEAVYTPRVKPRNKTELTKEVSEQKIAKTLFKKPEEIKAFIEGVKFAISLDEATITKEREKFERAKQEKERARAQAAAERKQRDAEIAARKAAEVAESFNQS